MKIRTERHPRRKSRGKHTVQTCYGVLTFEDGAPTPESAQWLQKMLTFSRAIEVYQQHLSAISMLRFRPVLAAPGHGVTRRVVVWKALLDTEGARMAGGSEMLCVCGFLDLRKDGPTVIEVGAGMRGVLDDMWMRVIGDVGPTGQDRGKGGSYLVLPPTYTGEVPQGYIILRSPTFGVWMLLHAIAGVERLEGLRICPLARAASITRMATNMEFLDRSDCAIDAGAPGDFRYFEQLGALVEQEPAEAVPLLERRYLSHLGMQAGCRFEPDEQLRTLLTEAAIVGRATASMSKAVHEAGSARMSSGADWRRIFVTGGDRMP